MPIDKYHFGNHEFADDPLDDLIEDFKYEAKQLGAKELWLIHDLEKNEYYPAYIMEGDDVNLKEREYNNLEMQQKIERKVPISPALDHSN